MIQLGSGSSYACRGFSAERDSDSSSFSDPGQVKEIHPFNGNQIYFLIDAL